MRFSKKLISILFIVLLFILFLIFYSNKNNYKYDTIIDVISPVEIQLENSGIYKLTNIQTFDAFYSDKNSTIAKKFNMTEDEAFIFGVQLRRY